jgi:hypothetical protein
MEYTYCFKEVRASSTVLVKYLTCVREWVYRRLIFYGYLRVRKFQVQTFFCNVTNMGLLTSSNRNEIQAIPDVSSRPEE